MIYLILGILTICVIVGVTTYFGNIRRHQNTQKNGEIIATDNSQELVPASDCCGQHEVCERDSLLSAVSKNIEYYDDEELDAYQGKDSSEYDEKAVNEFREVFYTMQETDVAGWLRSLQLRNINLPDQLKDEVFLIVEERRNN